MKICIPLSLSLAMGFSGLVAPALADEVLEPVELEIAEAVTDETVMPQVTVQAKQDFEDEEKGYQPNKTRIGKTNQLPKDIPQSVTVVTEQLMQDRSANTLKEALRNVAGITFNAGEGGRVGDNITLRGYSAVGDLYLDGLRDMAQYNRDTFNLEQVEVLRGSASMLYGRGSTGGVINQVSKTPEAKDHYKLDLSGGTYRYMRGVLDVNKKLTPMLTGRINLMGTSAESFRQFVEQKRFGIAPSLTWGLGSKNEVTAAYYYLHENNIPDFGVPYFRGRPIDVPINRFYGMANADYERNRTSIATLSYVHRFNENHELRTILRQAYYTRDMRAIAPRLVGRPSEMSGDILINRSRQARGGTEKTLTAQTEYNGKFATGFLKHDVLAGYAMNWEKSIRWTNVSPYTNPRTTAGYPTVHPILPSDFDDSFSRENRNYYTGLTNSVYAQDTVQVIPHVKLMMGTRFDRMRADYDRPSPAGPLERLDNVWSYRGGLLYQPNQQSTYYVSYSSSFNPSAELYQLDDRTSNTDPEKSRNMEAGAKWELFGGNLSLRTAVFRSEKTNERNTDLTMANVAVLSGKRHTDGIEIESAGRITKNWQVFSSVALMRSNIDKASGQQIGSLNKRPINTPNYTYSLWSTYSFRFHGNWKIGAGLEGVGDRFGNATYAINRNLVPAYKRVDAMVEYSREKYAVKLNLYNVLNQKYYEGVYAGHVIPGTSLAGLLTLSLKL